MMGQIEVLYDLGEPYVRLEDYRAVQARAATLAAEVERLTVETAAYRSDWRAWEALARLNIEYTGNDPLERLAEEVAALRAQLAEEGWRQDGEWPFGGEVFEARLRVYEERGLVGYTYEIVEWRPAPPQE